MVRAHLTDDAYTQEVCFDATEFLATAPLWQIAELARIGWCGGEAGDRVAAASTDPAVVAWLAALGRQNQDLEDVGEAIGYFVVMEPEPALAWLCVHRLEAWMVASQIPGWPVPARPRGWLGG